MALNSLKRADVLLRNYSVTHSVTFDLIESRSSVAVVVNCYYYFRLMAIFPGKPRSASWVLLLHLFQKRLGIRGMRFLYNMITIFTCAQKLTNSQLSLLHGTKNQKRVMKTTKKQKNQDAEKKSSSHKVHEVSRICGRGRFWAGSERVGKLWMSFLRHNH